jgi:hypothetical protein
MIIIFIFVYQVIFEDGLCKLAVRLRANEGLKKRIEIAGVSLVGEPDVPLSGLLCNFLIVFVVIFVKVVSWFWTLRPIDAANE